MNTTDFPDTSSIDSQGRSTPVSSINTAKAPKQTTIKERHVRLLSLTEVARYDNHKEWYRRNDYVRFNCPMPRTLAIALRAEAVKQGKALHKLVGTLLSEALAKEAVPLEHARSAEELLG